MILLEAWLRDTMAALNAELKVVSSSTPQVPQSFALALQDNAVPVSQEAFSN